MNDQKLKTSTTCSFSRKLYYETLGNRRRVRRGKLGGWPSRFGAENALLLSDVLLLGSLLWHSWDSLSDAWEYTQQLVRSLG